ncbi:hypothetical protein GCM10023259_037850 [Thermocatellispora tengchongensis]
MPARQTYAARPAARRRSPAPYPPPQGGDRQAAVRNATPNPAATADRQAPGYGPNPTGNAIPINAVKPP